MITKRYAGLLVLAFLLSLSSSTLAADEQPKDTNASGDGHVSDTLYIVQLEDLHIPDSILEKALTQFDALMDTYLYVVVLVDGRPTWISPIQSVHPNQLTFQWPKEASSTFPVLWRPGTPVTIRVIVTTDGTDRKQLLGATTAGGAGLGAIIGAIAAGTVTGGLGAPAGAAIGAIIGGGVGGAGGGIAYVLSDQERVALEESLVGKDTFPLQDDLHWSVADGLGRELTSTVTFRLNESVRAIERGHLQPGKTYLVRFKEIRVSQRAAEKGGSEGEAAEYYVELRQGKSKYPFFKDSQPRLMPGSPLRPPALFTPFNNTGDETEVRIYESDFWGDDVVFSSRIPRLDGKTWAFQGKASSDDTSDTESYVVFETYDPFK